MFDLSQQNIDKAFSVTRAIIEKGVNFNAVQIPAFNSGSHWSSFDGYRH
jgi:hypothetical protein